MTKLCIYFLFFASSFLGVCAAAQEQNMPIKTKKTRYLSEFGMYTGIQINSASSNHNQVDYSAFHGAHLGAFYGLNFSVVRFEIAGELLRSNFRINHQPPPFPQYSIDINEQIWSPKIGFTLSINFLRFKNHALYLGSGINFTAFRFPISSLDVNHKAPYFDPVLGHPNYRTVYYSKLYDTYDNLTEIPFFATYVSKNHRFPFFVRLASNLNIFSPTPKIHISYFEDPPNGANLESFKVALEQRMWQISAGIKLWQQKE